MSDRGYINLIRHLTRASSTLPLETLQASIAHYLARPPVPIPGSPTTLTATALNSPLFRIHTHARLSAVALAFRHAVHLRVGVLKEEAEANPGGLLSRGVNVGAQLARWSKDVREGFKGSDAVMHLACASGLLLGLEDWEAELQLKEKERRERARVEEEVVIALAEVIDEYAREGSGWEKDFKRTAGAKGDEDPLPLAMLLASQCGQCIAAERLQALPLPIIIDVLMTTIDRSFYSGAFLSGASLSANTDADGRISIESTSSFAQTIRACASSSYVASMSSIARFTARTLTVLVESRRAPGWEAIGRVLTRLQSITSKVEQDWTKCPLARANKEDDLASGETRDIATATWSILKTLLFMTLMLSQSILAAVVFVPNPHSQPVSPVSPHSIALNILHVLAQLSFVMPQFGGVASTAEGGLPELKRAFYMTLDVLAASDEAAERFVAELCQGQAISEKGKGVDNIPRSLQDAREAFVLACVEQLVAKLSEETIQTRVFPLCLPHLWDPSYRETYESAHSVMLAIFAAHAQGAGRKDELHRARAHPAFVEKLVPMYAQCLVENSSDGRLSTTQLSMAYAALVRSASAFGHDRRDSGESTPAGDAMGWLCIEVLLDAIRQACSTETSTPPSEHLHRLHLALVATVPTVSLSLLPRLLSEVRSMITSLSPAEGKTGEMRSELVQALFKVILQDIGDAEKEFVIDWWDENREQLVGRSGLVTDAESTGSLAARL
ncbi:hypothetical protein GY45DRAFT_1319349 [Cubamyces sp. BRFM 1775]|nr:hypothetical protein GY45DRAFT_1319349 [Cubamyces sp. BRFM 1775]